MRKLTGRGVLVWLGGFFGVIIAANIWFVALSIASFRGEDRVRPYQQGLDYNSRLEARARQRAEGWHAVIALEEAAGKRLRVRVTAPDGARVTGLKLAGVLRHPTDTFRDAALTLTPDGPGVYVARIEGVSAGWRDVEIHTESGVPFEAVRRIWLP